MKSGLYLFLLLLLATVGYSQSDKIPKGANRIEVSTTLSDSALFDMISFRLESVGFFIEQSNLEKGYIITEYKNVNKPDTDPISIKVIVGISSNKAVFRGQGDAEVLGYKYTNVPLVYRGSGSGVEKSGFVSLTELVKKISKTIGTSSINYLTGSN
ncbi:hypothetical protein [Spirosoma foliorum]|uniref:Uncharacterized protein n=1 Tax=Spirosoma foliorum TaxID=2710596 RepID=A0A7G5GUZ6_9BACT|nr:hypothetical protein [Spirosoma foliorum]QMW02688.1 hypothetical protein H3H32_33100 [Spirosoma foliorum]